MIIIQLAVMTCCGWIAYQDFRERSVLWFLFPITGLLLAKICLMHIPWNQYLIFTTTNVLLVSGILLLLFLYTKHIAGKKFLNTSFGLGDMMFFYAFALGFPTITFVLLFVGAILFSLVASIVLNGRHSMDTVPLAGLMGIFIIVVTLVNLFPGTPSLFIL